VFCLQYDNHWLITSVLRAPEVAKMELYNEKCDVFSFGVLLWEILSLSKAFPQFKTKRELYDKISVKGVRPSIPKLKWPGMVETILSSSWKADPKERPTMKQICSMLNVVLFDMSDKESIRNRSEVLKDRSIRSIHRSMVRDGREYGRQSSHPMDGELE
jgi:hypothetical protein